MNTAYSNTIFSFSFGSRKPSFVLAYDRTSAISYNYYVLQDYSEILVSFSFFIKAILKL